MRSIATVDYHTAGEPFRIVPAGVVPPGRTVLERRANAPETVDDVRRMLVDEPRGHADMYGGFVVPPDDAGADLGVVFWHAEGYSTACGHGTIALVTWAIESGRLVVPGDGEHAVRVDVPSGRVLTRARVAGGRVRSVAFVNVQSFVLAEGVRVDAEAAARAAGRSVPASGASAGRSAVDASAAGASAVDASAAGTSAAGASAAGASAVDASAAGASAVDASAAGASAVHASAAGASAVATIAYGGAFYVLLEAAAVGLDCVPADVGGLIAAGRAIKAQVGAEVEVVHPLEPGLRGVYGVVFTAGHRNVTVFADGEVDRSPCGSGTSARLAALHAEGSLATGSPYEHESVVGTRFTGRVLSETTVAGRPAVVTEVVGSAFPTGEHRFLLDPDDPVGTGFRLR